MKAYRGFESLLLRHGRLAQLGEHLVYTERVGSSSLSSSTILCGRSSVVERHLAKVNVARSNRVTRFYMNLKIILFKVYLSHRKGGRVVDCNGFENRRSESYRGFESPPFRINSSPGGIGRHAGFRNQCLRVRVRVPRRATYSIIL